MLFPEPTPPEQTAEAPGSEAVVVTDELHQTPHGWERTITYWHRGEDYQYGLYPMPAPGYQPILTEDEARRRLFGPTVVADIRTAFLREVHLDLTRPH